jgi:hypothetical protein
MLLQILTGAPLYAYAILPVLIWYGWMQSRTREAGKPKVLMLPIIMTFLSFGGVVQSFGPHLPGLVTWVIGFVLAAVANQVARAPAGVRYNATTRRFHLPGNWTPLVLMMVIYAAKYTVGTVTALAPDMVGTVGFVATLSFVFGGASGIFFGRFLRIWSTSLMSRRLTDAPRAGLERSV